MTVTKNWKDLVAEKRKQIKESIPKEWILPVEVTEKYDETTPISVLDLPKEFLSEKEFDITENYTVKELIEKLATSKFSAIDVVKAFSHRAAIATQVTNCCTEIMFDYGFERAKFLDKYLLENGTPFGPLHGFPISLKDSFKVPGYDSTIGFVAFIGNKSDEESAMVKMLYDLGAVFYVKTNIPQTLMTGDSENNIFGRTLNPKNLTWTAGGSTGGEGALIKMRGSLLGIGSDIAGSIRIPSLCNGVYGYRPTSNRYPDEGQVNPSRNTYAGVKPVCGPLSTDLEAIEMITKLVYNNNPWKYDLSASHVEYRETDLEGKKLKIGVVLSDKLLPVHPPLKRIIEEVSTTLKKAGHSVETIHSVPSYDTAWSLAWQLFQVDPKSTAFKTLFDAGEPLIKSLQLPGMDVYGKGPSTLEEYLELNIKLQAFKDEWAEIFKDFDIVISPGAPGTAPPHDDYGIAPYTTVWNVVDYPAIVIPHGEADAEKDVDDGAIYDPKLKHIYAHYDPALYNGGIGHIQVCAPPMDDEKLISASILINKIINQ